MNFTTDAQLRQWLQAMLEQRNVIAPVRQPPEVTPIDDPFVYAPVSSPDQVAFDFTRTRLSPKEYFLPATETILEVERTRRGGGGPGGDPTWDVTLSVPPLERDALLFAVRPCDVHALQVLDALLLREPADTYYARRRERTLLVGLACEAMDNNCFCTSLGSTPDDPTGMDLILYRAEGGYAWQAVSEKGDSAAQGLAAEPYQGEAGPRTWPERSFTVAPEPTWAQRFNDPAWANLADRCLSCRICSYVCPTCRCFDVRDYRTAEGAGHQTIERVRCWDSCLGEGYRRIAGGHNPRASKMQRLRNRFYCKFDYYPADFGPMACVGCGRCIEQCPVNIDITEVLELVAR